MVSGQSERRVQKPAPSSVKVKARVIPARALIDAARSSVAACVGVFATVRIGFDGDGEPVFVVLRYLRIAHNDTVSAFADVNDLGGIAVAANGIRDSLTDLDAACVAHGAFVGNNADCFGIVFHGFRFA